VAGIAQGTRRKVDFKPFAHNQYYPYTVHVRFRDGGTVERTVVLHGGWRVPLPISPPRATPLEMVLQAGHNVSVWSVAFSPDGRRALTGSLDGSAVLWDVESGLQLRTFRGRSDTVRSVAFSPDGRQIATAGAGDNGQPYGDAVLFDTETGREIARFQGHKADVWSLAFSPDGKYLVTGSLDRTALLWNTSTRERLRTFEGHRDEVLSVAFSPDGRKVVTGSRDRTAILWDIESGLKVRSFVAHSDAIRALAFRPGEGAAQIATASYDGTACLWDVDSGQVQHVLKGHSAPVHAIAYAPAGGTLFTGARDGVVIEWDSETGREIRRIPSHNNWIQSLAVSRSGGLLLAGYDDNRAILTSLATGKPRKTLVGHTAMIGPVALSNDGRRLICGHTPDVAAVWDFEKAQRMYTLRKHAPVAFGESNSVQAVAISPDGRHALTGARDHTAILWEVITGQPLRSFAGLKGEVLAVAFRPDGQRIATAGGQFGAAGRTNGFGEVVVWDAQTRQQLVALQGPRDAVFSVAYSPDGRYLLTGDRASQVLLWNADTGQLVRRLQGHEAPISAVAYSPDGRLIVTASLDQTAIIWNAATFQAMRRLKGHTRWLNAAAFSPDSRLVVTASFDQTAIVWDAESGRALQTLRGHTDNVMSAAFRSNGRQVVTGSWDGTARIWDIATGDELGRMISLDSGSDWLVAAPDGLFDGSAGGREKVAYRIGSGLNVVAVDRFFQECFRPGLLSALATGQRPKMSIDLGRSLPPVVRVVSPERDGPAETGRVSVEIEATDQGGGVAEPRIYQNGGRVRMKGTLTRQARGLRDLIPIDLVEGDNHIEVRASSADGTWDSEPARLSLRYNKPPEKPVLYMLAVGVNRYAQARINLEYASADARAMAALFRHRGKALYRELRVVELVDEQATRKAISAALDQFSKDAQPRDTLVVFLAGHGVMVGERYYFIPSEFERAEGNTIEADIRAQGLPADVIADALTAIPALKRLLVIDTCQAGGAVLPVPRTRAAIGLRGAIERLGRATGVFAIAAAAPGQEAHEVAELGHGVLSYSLLAGLHDVQSGPLRDQPIASAPDHIADALTWFAFASTQVPQLTRRYFGTEQDVQTTTQGMSFPVLPIED
jgi:WD40 repeat protein